MPVGPASGYAVLPGVVLIHVLADEPRLVAGAPEPRGQIVLVVAFGVVLLVAGAGIYVCWVMRWLWA
jgi:hypothetical protein